MKSEIDYFDGCVSFLRDALTRQMIHQNNVISENAMRHAFSTEEESIHIMAEMEAEERLTYNYMLALQCVLIVKDTALNGIPVVGRETITKDDCEWKGPLYQYWPKEYRKVDLQIPFDKWVPADKHLPSFYPMKRRKVLVTLEDPDGKRFVTTAMYNEALKCWGDFSDRRYKNFKVIAWTEKPMPYWSPEERLRERMKEEMNGFSSR